VIRSLLFLLTLTACTQTREVGTQGRPFQMFFVPSEDTQRITASADAMGSFVSKRVSQKLYGEDTGFYVRTAIPSSYIAVVEAIGSGRADFAALNTFSYYLLKEVKRYPAEAILNVVRGENETTYKSQIIAHVDSGIDSIQDVDGKKFAFTDPASTAGYILPNKLFRTKGIQPSETTFAMRHDSVVTMVYQRQVDAGATYFSPPRTEVQNGQTVNVIRDARSKVKVQFPDIEEKVKIVGFSEDIPNAPWVIRSNIFRDDHDKYARVKSAIQEALIEFAKTDEGKEILDGLYDISGLVVASDEDFSSTLTMLREAGVDVERQMK